MLSSFDAGTAVAMVILAPISNVWIHLFLCSY